MRARKTATLVGTLLVLSAFLIPGGVAKTGDATCAAEEVWIDDATGDGGNFQSDPASVSGAMDIDDLLVAEAGTNCASILFTFTVEGTDFAVGAPDSVTYSVDIEDAGTGVADYTMDFTFGSGETASLLKDGTAVTDGVTAGGTGASLTLEVEKAVFENVGQWDGAAITTSALGGDAADVQTLLLSEDSASTDVVLLVNYGLDTDGDGLPDAYEVDTYGDLTTSDGTTDTDGDGISDADEYANGTDPNDPLDPEPEEDTEDDGPTLPGEDDRDPTITDGDDEFGLDDCATSPLGHMDIYTYTFDETGVWSFHDHDHPMVAGNITIEEAHDHAEGEEHGATTHTLVINEGHVMTENQYHANHDHANHDAFELTIEEGDSVTFINLDETEYCIEGHEESGGAGLDFGKVEEESSYALIAGGGAAAVVLLSIVALLARWKA